MEFRLKKLRKEKNISQLKLAIDLNMNQNTISRYENLEREADYETLIQFADYFNVSLDYLLASLVKLYLMFSELMSYRKEQSL